jgi:glycosyltransferase involved in cell wall biosynthesis
LKEFFGICFLEAMATGVPCVGHEYPVTKWVIGDGGVCIDMAREGALAECLAGVTESWILEHGRQARQRAEKMFSKEVVIAQMIGMYREVAANQSSDSYGRG